MARNLATPGNANQIIVKQYPPVGLKLFSSGYANDKILVTQPDELRQIAGLSFGSVNLHDYGLRCCLKKSVIAL